ncbi:DNA-binding transcriptional regulator, LysR family [Oribacterium sp. KHPX15]|uniref:LysR family transcriptional regulator n=1 Tax=Oribacterium sp. KHPX15 TaxID=1855342 RepID=UPI0008989DD8|nr:LysR family transcriptional regulator [Oribacterium sp. KHPX15]SEA93917.1 DNA-binding transcriptional regulator, LysR family [Oribacterium sp. KHPX15]
MDFKQLEYIVAIADSGNLSRAADKLFITRSALNYSLLNLEKELGGPLFKRLNNQMVLTSMGELYVKYARKILLLSHECNSILRDFNDNTKGTLNIGITPGYGQKVFQAVYPEFYKKYPAYDITLKEANARQLYTYLHEGVIDFAWCAFHNRSLGLEHIILNESEILLAVPDSMITDDSATVNTSNDAPVSLEKFKSSQFILMNQSSLIREITDIYFEKAHIHPHIMFECSTISMARSFAQKGIALTFLPKAMCLPNIGLTYFHLPWPETFGLSITYRKDAYLTQADWFLINKMKEFYPIVLNNEINIK